MIWMDTIAGDYTRHIGDPWARNSVTKQDRKGTRWVVLWTLLSLGDLELGVPRWPLLIHRACCKKCGTLLILPWRDVLTRIQDRDGEERGSHSILFGERNWFSKLPTRWNWIHGGAECWTGKKKQGFVPPAKMYKRPEGCYQLIEHGIKIKKWILRWYPLVNVYMTMERSAIWMGMLTISMAYVTNYQRVAIDLLIALWISL